MTNDYWHGHELHKQKDIKGVPIESLLHADLSSILKTITALRDSINWLENNISDSVYHDTISNGVITWEMTGLMFRNMGRFPEAIAIFNKLYHKMCKAMIDTKKWIHKGMPLVWLSDLNAYLGFRWHREKYLIMTLIEDSIREKGHITPEKGGIYHRLITYRGYSHDCFNNISERAYEKYSMDISSKCENVRTFAMFPEYILLEIGDCYSPPPALPSECKEYIINFIFAEKLILLLENHVDKTGEILEIFSAYVLGCIPGFQIRRRKNTKNYHFDGFIRVNGEYNDYRKDLGLYVIVECKDWSKPIGAEEIGYFAHKLSVHDCKAGILFSKEGITGKNNNIPHFGILSILKSYHHLGRIILILDINHFKAVVRGENLADILMKKYEEVRFDF